MAGLLSHLDTVNIIFHNLYNVKRFPFSMKMVLTQDQLDQKLKERIPPRIVLIRSGINFS